MLEMLARARSKLGSKLRAHARTCLYSLILGYQCSYLLGAWDFGARPIPTNLVWEFLMLDFI